MRLGVGLQLHRVYPIDLVKAKGRKEPVGVTKFWGENQVEVMKIDDEPNQRNGSNWINVSVPKRLKSAAKHIDNLGVSIMNHKRPLDGEKLMDKMLVDFYEKKMGYSKDEAMNMPGKFKALGGFFGSSTYSFYNYFLKVGMAGKINDKLKKKMAHYHRAVDIWKREGEKGSPPPGYHPMLEPEIEISDKELAGMKSTAEEAVRVLDRGLTFEGKEKEAYDNLINASNSWPKKYRPLPDILEEKTRLWKEFDDVFAGEHDWLVKDVLREQVQKKYDEYFENFKVQIMWDEGKRVSTEYGLEFDYPTTEFYEKMRGILNDESRTLSDDEVDALLKVRFKLYTGLDLEGEWTRENFPVVENTELIGSELPKGHFLTNDTIHRIETNQYAGGHGYAYYSNREKQITLSKDFISNTSIKGVLVDKNEFYAVVTHEIGHAVDKKYSGMNDLGYKVWISLCGWDNRQENLHATGDQKDIPRRGRNSGIPLITEYAHKSPSEAFAEYYACYANNKKVIDKWLDTDDTSHLDENEGTVIRKWNYWSDGFKRTIERKVASKGVIYRFDNVPTSTIVDGKEMFKFMRDAIWGQDVIAKSLGWNPFNIYNAKNNK